MSQHYTIANCNGQQPDDYHQLIKLRIHTHNYFSNQHRNKYFVDLHKKSL